MKVSSRFRYGLRLLLDLAHNHKKGPVLLKDIASCENISKKYLEQIVIALRNAGMIRGTRGSKGGYSLIKTPHEVKLIEVYKILEGSFSTVDCLDDPSICSLLDTCTTRKLWSRLSKSIKDVFENLTLADLTKDELKLRIH